MADPKKDPKAPIPVVTPTGKVGYLPPELAADAGAQGLRDASDREMRGAQLRANEEVQSEALRKKFEGNGLTAAIEGAVMPDVAAFARGASIGTSDEAVLGIAESLGGTEGREAVRSRLNDYKEYAPIRSFTSELGGAIGASALTDGAAAPEAAGGAIRSAARVLGRGAVEGAVYGAGGAASEAALKDERLTGEALVGGAAHGALGGMLISGAFHGAGSALKGLRAPKGSPAAYESLAAGHFGEAAPGIGKEMAMAEGKVHMPEAPPVTAYRTPEPGAVRSSLFDTPADVAIKVGSRGDEAKAGELGEIWKNREVAFNDGAERIEGHSRDVTKAITDQQAAARVTDMATYGDAKVNHMDKLVDRSRFDEQAGQVMDWMFRAQDTANLLASDTAVTKFSPMVRREFDGHMARLAKAMETGDSNVLFKAADDAKRFLGRAAEFGRGARGLSESARSFDALYQGEGGLQKVLEHDSWGKAAEAQKSVNAAAADWISSSRRWEQKFVTQNGSLEGRPINVGNSESVVSFMGRLTKAANDLDATAFRDAVASRRRFLTATEKSYDHGAEATAAFAQERAALDKMEAAFEKATKETSLINQAKRLQSEEQAQKIGGLIGLATDTLSKPVTTLQRLAQLESHTQGVVKKLRGDTGSLLGAAKQAEPAGLGVPKGKGKGFFSTLLDQTPNTGGAVGGVAEGKRAQYQRRVEALASLHANPAAVADRVGNALDPFAAAAPKATATATATTVAGLNFLFAKMPPSRLDPYSLQPQLQPRNRASDAEISQFMRFTQAIDDPLVVLREAKSGTLTRDHVEAVKSVYPRLYDEMRGEVIRTLIDSKSPLPYARRIQLGILLDIPTDKTLSPDFLTAIQATYTSEEKAGAESPPPSLSRPLNVAGTEQTAMQQAVERVSQ